MKGLILAGGAGTRLRPITHTSAKQLVPVANKPILFYGLEAMAEAGITDIGMIVGDTRDEMKAAVGDGSRWGVRVTYIAQDQPLGLAHCVLVARDFLGDDHFVMYLGDNLLRQGLKEFVEDFEKDAGDAAAQILLARVPDPHRFGVVDLGPDGEVVRLVEKPADPPSDLALVGVYLFDERVHQAVVSIRPSARGELEITDAIQWLVDHGHRVRTRIVEGWWIDTGKLTPLLEANRLILETLEQSVEGKVDDSSQIEGRVVVEAGAEIIRSTVRGPAIIGEGTRIVDSYIGPFTAIQHDCEVTGSEVEHSVVLERSRITDAGRIVDSLIGKDVEVFRSGQRPRANRLMLGDHSSVDLD
jgi:glucose-1-phosphate thymidylyltransferase